MEAPIIWAQRKDKVLATVNVIDVTDATLRIEGQTFTFKGHAGGQEYASRLELFAEVEEKESHYVIRPRGVQVALAKKDTSVWWPRLVKSAAKMHWITVDWNRWVDSSDDEEQAEFNWDPSEMGNFGDDDDGMEDVAPEAEPSEPAVEQ